MGRYGVVGLSVSDCCARVGWVIVLICQFIASHGCVHGGGVRKIQRGEKPFIMTVPHQYGRPVVDRRLRRGAIHSLIVESACRRFGLSEVPLSTKV